MKTIKIPKIREKELLKLYINRTEIQLFPNGDYEVTLKKGQIVHGMIIPEGIQMKAQVINAEFSSQPYIYLHTEEANGFLKMLYINNLRHKYNIPPNAKYPKTYNESFRK